MIQPEVSDSIIFRTVSFENATPGGKMTREISVIRQSNDTAYTALGGNTLEWPC